MKYIGLGINNSGYPGAFTPVVNRIIVDNAISTLPEKSRVLHLFSCSSEIGDVRVDLKCLEATHRQDVLEFIRSNGRIWDLVILDPPYGIEPRNKLNEYAKTSSLAADVILRRELIEYFRSHARDLLWLDSCAPIPKPFYRVYLWVLLAGGFRPVRVLSWLRNELKI